MKTIVIVSSYHHHNTLQVAQAMAEALQTQAVSPDQVQPDALSDYDLIGFGSGIYDGKHHPALLRLAEALPVREGARAFLFSTDGVPRFAMKNQSYLHPKMLDDHAALRQRLEAKGYAIVGNFGCAGFNTNSFLKLFGGFNKGRPNRDDLAKARAFTESLSPQADR